MENIYANIAARTGGNIYIGVLGPVRTGKSTLIKRIMEQMVIPNIPEPYRKERAKDELPQSASGRTIMTSEPKFIPEESVEISPDGTTTFRIRMIDTVGYMIDGAIGADENGQPRMVTTPWFDHEIPMVDAAELGTKKVMEEHCSIGLIITTDGTVTDIPRNDYISAESRAIKDIQKTGKPFLTIINSRNPQGEAALKTKQYIHATFGVDSVIADCQSLSDNDIANLFKSILYAFPLQQLNVYFPRWMDALELTHPVKSSLYQSLLSDFSSTATLAQAEQSLQKISQVTDVQDFAVRSTDLATGTVSVSLTFPESLFYEIISSKAGITIEDDAQLIDTLTTFSTIKAEYDQISDALSSVKATGYGIVMPDASQMKLQTPELIHKSGAYGIKLKAEAPSIHMIRVDIDTQISPIIGGEEQSKDLMSYLSSEEPEKLWESNIFGKSVYTLIQDGLNTKLIQTSSEVRDKFRNTLNRIVNEGANGLICLIL